MVRIGVPGDRRRAPSGAGIGFWQWQGAVAEVVGGNRSISGTGIGTSPATGRACYGL